jgi:glycosyltransferase involved in cell wall biosynthesis
VLVLVENVPLARDHRLRKQAAALLASQFDVTVICRRDPRNKTCVPGIRVLEYPAPPEGSSLLAFAWEYAYSVTMAAVLTFWAGVRHGFDVLQIASTPDIYFLVAMPCRWFGRPVVFDFRDPSPETYQARFAGHPASGGYSTGGGTYRLLLRLERYSLRVADRVLVVNESLRRMARERGGVDDARIVLVGNGPLLSRVTERPPRSELWADPPDQLAANGQRVQSKLRYLCCWVGMMGPQDRIDLALRAIDHLVHVMKRTDCAFIFVGEGDARHAAQELAAELRIENWVLFTGWLDEEAVFRYLVTADLGLEPNVEDYVSPVKVMEYLAAGLPIVAFDAAETVGLAGDAARYAPKEDVAEMARLIDELIDSPVTRMRIGQIGQARVTDFIAWEHQAGRYIAALTELLRRTRLGRPGRGSTRRGWTRRGWTRRGWTRLAGRSR